MNGSWKLQFLVCAAAAALCLPAAGQPAFRVADVNTVSPGSTWIWPYGMEVAEAAGRVFFGVTDGIHGTELWATDGTEAGTALVRDICPGICGASPLDFAAVGGLLYFSADDGAHGHELWVSDGTRAGTRLVTDLRSGLQGSVPHALAELDGRVLFTADDGVHGSELWASDGTPEGTVLVADLAAGPAGSSPAAWARLGTRLIFAADDGIHGTEPWATDGTTDGTVMLANIGSGNGHGVDNVEPHEDYSFVAEAAGRLFFAGATNELWTTDGTPAGTVRIEAIDPKLSGPRNLVSNGATVFFTFIDEIHGNELWATDGTAAGTRLVRDIWPGQIWSTPANLTVLDGRVFFHALDPAHGRELWVSDGTEAGTVLLKDVHPADHGFPLFDALHTLRAVGSRLLFFADDGTHGNEPWVTDGTAAGTALLADLRPGSAGSYLFSEAFRPDHPRVAGGRLYFRAFGAEGNLEVWSSDGTAAGTAQLAEINTQSSAFQPLFLGRLWGPRPFGAIGASGTSGEGGRLLFPADDGVTGPDPWVTDGTTAGTARLTDHAPGLLPYQLEVTPLGDLTLFQASTGTNTNSIWVTDGTPGGTVSLSTSHAELSWLTPLPAGDAVVFSRDGGLLRSDGTPAGTVPVPNTPRGEAFTPLGGELIFRSGRTVLFATDGVNPRRHLESFAGEINRLTAAGPRVFFTVAEPATGRELWKTDGTHAGTVLVKDIVPGPGSGLRQVYDLPDFRDELFASLGSRLFFIADGGTTGEELWTSDGTAAGTVLVKDVLPGLRSSEIRHLTAAAGRVFFVADDGVHGRELWITDGTAAGTRLVEDIRPGPDSSLPRELTPLDGVDGLLLFAAEDGVRGVEPWKSNGTAAGTFAIQDIAPGALPSSPLEITPAGPNVYFAANDGTTGFELWALPRAALSHFADVPPSHWAWPFVEALAAAGVSSGCGNGNFCPGAQVNRAQMAVFLVSAVHGPGFTPPPATGTRFTDVPANAFAAAHIEQLAADGITSGCAPTPPRYCPDAKVSRAQMAVFLLVAKHGAGYTPPAGTGTVFSDVGPGHWAKDWIEQLAAEGITGGCSGGNFCPDGLVTRAEMAVFLTAAFELLP